MKTIATIVVFTISLFGYWGFNAKGVVNNFSTDKKNVVLTLDACGGSAKSSGFDSELIDFLIKNKISATLFINSRWIDSNPAVFLKLAKNPLFEIQNHGTKHQPLSLNGMSAYGIEGTKSAQEVKAEVLGNHEKVLELTGQTMHFFRSGTAHYDDESVQIAESLGYKVIGFSVNADAGATNSAIQIQREFAKIKPGDIVIAHMNHPESQNAKGLAVALARLKKEGWSFLTISEAMKK